MAEPRKSAAGILFVQDKDLKILLTRRSPSLKFMGGYHVFPGGKIDTDEPTERVINATDPVQAAAIHAVTREIFEETGILVAEGGVVPVEERRSARGAVLNDEASFDEFLERFNLHIDASSFDPAGVFVTPEFSSLRFHTRYYAIRRQVIGDEDLLVGEVDELEWMTPHEARDRWRRGNLRLPPPVAYTLQQLERYSLSQALSRLKISADYTADSGGPIEVTYGIFMLPLESPTLPPTRHTNCILIGDRELYVVDPGATDPNEHRRFKVHVDHMLGEDGCIKAVILTHSHIDHVAAATFVRDTYGAPIWAHPVTAERLDFPVDRLLQDEELITVSGDPDWRLRCLHTPGHDPGHLCLLEETTSTLIAGDMISGHTSVLIPYELGGNMADYLDSLNRLLDVDFDVMIPAHGFFIHRPKDKIRTQIQHRLWREKRIRAALDSGVDNIQDLLAAVYDDVSPEKWRYAESSLRAHLAKLGVTEFK